MERAALDGFPRLGEGIEFPGVWKTYEKLQGGAVTGHWPGTHGKITLGQGGHNWETLEELGVCVCVFFSILFGIHFKFNY